VPQVLRQIAVSVSELRRRSVFRIGAAYLVGAFALLQLVSAVQGALRLSAGGMRMVIIGLLIGFPVALFLAWAFDLGPDGVHRDTHDGTPSKKWLELTIIGVLTLVVGAIGYTVYRPEDIGRGFDASDKSIAVLPFANLSDDPANEYFGDGIAEELLNVLAKQADLRVAARTSSFAYKGRNEDVRRIGNELNVATVLEGSIRKQGDRVRITAQLINVADGYHLWSETYDRKLDDIFAIQDEIAGAIGQALKVTLLGKEAHAADHLGTRSVTAYDLYLLGRHRWRERNEEGLEAALEHFQKAIAADPGFARAYSGLADTYLLLADHGDLKQAEALSKAEAAVAEALRLDPQLAEAHASLGLIRTNQGKPDEARVAFEQALKLDPEYVFAHLWYANLFNDTEERAQKLAEYERALALDPLLIPANVNLAGQYMNLGRYRDAVTLYERLTRLQPDRQSYFYTRGGEALRRAGALAEAVQLFRRALDADPWNLEPVVRLAQSYADLGDATEAKRWAEHARRLDAEDALTLYARISAMAVVPERGATDLVDALVKRVGLLNAGEISGWRVVAAVLERDPRAGEFARAMEQQFGGALDQNEGLVAFTPYLAHALQGSDPARARVLTEAALAFVRAEQAAGTRRSDILYAGAQLEALAGRRAEGIALLQDALLNGFTMTFLLRDDPIIETLRADPAFEPLRAAAETSLAAQSAVLKAAKLPAWTPPTRPTPVAIDPALLDGLVGYYSHTNNNQLVQLVREGDALIQVDNSRVRNRMYPASATEFFDATSSARSVFKVDAEGHASGFTRWITGFPIRLKRVDWTPPVKGTDDRTEWPALVGNYRLDNKRVVRVWIEGDRLVGQQTGGAKLMVATEAPGQYFIEEAPVRLQFLRGPDGKVTAMRVLQPDDQIDLPRVQD
jgi:TolB-like protein/Tfp pilus assembly protein PilF